MKAIIRHTLVGLAFLIGFIGIVTVITVGCVYAPLLTGVIVGIPLLLFMSWCIGWTFSEARRL